MKKSFLSLLFLLSVSIAFAGNGFNLSGKIKNLKNCPLYLGNYYGDKQYIKDTTQVDADGNFVFSGSNTLPGGIYLIVTPAKHYFEILIDTGQHFSLETDRINFVKTMRISGSMDNTLFYQYLNFAIVNQKQSDSLYKLKTNNRTIDTIEINNKIKEVNKNINQYRRDFIAQHPGTLLAKVFITLPEPDVPEILRTDSDRWYYYRNHFLDNVDLTDDRLLRTPILHKKIERYLTELVPQIVDSIDMAIDALLLRAKPNKETFKYITWWVTYHYETTKIMGLDSVFKYMIWNYYAKGLCPWTDSIMLQKLIARAGNAKSTEPPTIGNTGTNLRLSTADGRIMRLSDIKSKRLVLFFWQPSSKKSVEEIDKLNSFYQSMHSNYDLEVIAINGDTDSTTWVNFINEHHLTWINAWDPANKSNYRKYYEIYSYPVIYLLDHQRIIAKRIDVEQLTKLMADLAERGKKKNQ